MMAAKRGKVERVGETGVIDVLVRAGAHLNEKERVSLFTT